jgi:hypothetical protein
MALFTKEELEAIRLADQEIEEDFYLTNEDLRHSRKLDREAQLEAMDPNKRKVAAQKKAYYEANRDKVAAQQKAWREKNPDYFRQRYQNRKLAAAT